MQETVIFGFTPWRHASRTGERSVRRRASRDAWALLLARIYEVFPLLCPKCGGERRINAPDKWRTVHSMPGANEFAPTTLLAGR